MAAHVVYQAHDGDGHQPGYVEIIIDEAADLTDLEVSVGGEMMDPAPGSIAYKPDHSEKYCCNSSGSWVAVDSSYDFGLLP